MFDSAAVRRLAVIVLALVAATVFDASPAVRQFQANAVDFHQSAHAHAPMPYEFTIQQGKADPSGQTDSGGRAVAHRAGGIEVTSAAVTRGAPDADRKSHV